MKLFYKKLLFLLLPLLPFTGATQTKTLAWVKEFDDEIRISRTIEDSDGNFYLVGNFIGTRDFDPGAGEVLIASGSDFSRDGFVMKLNPDGEFVWVKQIKSSDINYNADINPSEIQLGLNNELLVSGTSFTASDFGGTSIPAGVFLAKYSPDGDFLNARKIHSTGGLLGGGRLIRQDTDGSLYYWGSFQDSQDFDPSEEGEFILTTNTFSSPYLLKTDAAGNFIWATSWYVSMAPSFDQNGNLFISGRYDGNFTTDPVTGKPVLVRNQYSYQSQYSLLARVDPANGELIWVKYNPASSIRIDNTGNIFCYGAADGQPDFDPDPDTEYFLTGNVQHNFIQKLTNDGNLIWVKSMEGEGASMQELHFLDEGGFYVQSSSGYGTFDIDLDPNRTYLLQLSGGPYAVKYSADGELLDLIVGGGRFVTPLKPQHLVVTHGFYGSFDASLNPLNPQIIHSPSSLRLILAKYILTPTTCPSGILRFTRSSDIGLPSECTLFDGSIVVEGNQITNLSGLSHLEKITGNLIIRNTALTNLSDLAGLQAIGGKLDIDGNNSLTNLNGLNGLSQLGSFGLKNNTSLSRLPNLPGISALSGSLNIENNSGITQLGGFQELTIAGSILVSYNNALASMSGLKKLKTVNQSITIRNNQVLTDLTGLGNVETATPYVVITDNPLLSTCAIPWLCRHLGANKSVNISGNSSGCASRNEISVKCVDVPVTEILSFSASTVPGTPADLYKVQLSWALANEFNTSRIEIFRNIPSSSEKIGELAAGGIKVGPTTYNFVDESAKPGINQYYLTIYNASGQYLQSQRVMVEMDLPYAPLVMAGCSQISGTYNVAGIDPDGRYRYSANHYCVITAGIPCWDQTIYFDNGIWKLSVTAGLIAYNNTPSFPAPPSNGWVFYETSQEEFFCPSGMTISLPDTKTANCSGCNWSDPDTWVPVGVPTFENVVINGNVILDVAGTATGLTVNEGKSLLSPTGQKLTLHGKVSLEGELQAGELVSPGFFVSQEIDGTKLNVKSFNNPNQGNVRLTGNLTVVDPENPSQPSIVSSGRIFLGDYDLECNSIQFTESPRYGTFVVTDGQGSLRYHFPEGETGYKTLNIGNVLNGAYAHFPVQVKREQNTAGDAVISARVQPEMPLPVPDGSGYLRGLWEITASGNAAGETYTVSLGWDNLISSPFFTPGFNFSNAYVKRWDGYGWQNVSGPHQITTGTSVNSTGVSQFSHWAVFDAETTLPVTLVSFKASPAESNSVRLDWATTEEANASHFEVEHSLTGRDWSKVGEMKAAGNNTSLKSYTYIHTNPSLSVNYYRLKSVDLDGTSAYSNIESIRLGGNPLGGTAKELYAYPNPVSDRLYLKLANLNDISGLKLYSAAGNRVKASVNTETQSLDVRHLPAGIYLLKVDKADGTSETFRVLISR